MVGRRRRGGSLAADRLGVGVKRKNGVGSPGAAHLGAVAAAASGSASRKVPSLARAHTNGRPAAAVETAAATASCVVF